MKFLKFRPVDDQTANLTKLTLAGLDAFKFAEALPADRPGRVNPLRVIAAINTFFATRNNQPKEKESESKAKLSIDFFAVSDQTKQEESESGPRPTLSP
jgi:hypothetical protein